MKRIFAAAAIAAAMLGGTTVASHATPTKGIVQVAPVDLSFTGILPTGTAATGSILGNPTFATNGFDFFAFTVPVTGSYNIRAQVGTASPDLTFTAFDFFTAPTGLNSDIYGSKGVIYTDSVTGDSAGFLKFRHFNKGVYYVGVEASGPAGDAYSGTLFVKSVPLPTSVALMGTALAGLGVAGALRRKKGAATAA